MSERKALIISDPAELRMLSLLLTEAIANRFQTRKEDYACLKLERRAREALAEVEDSQ